MRRTLSAVLELRGRVVGGSGLELVDLPPSTIDPEAPRIEYRPPAEERPAPAPLPVGCRLRLWHQWTLYRVPGGGSYVACEHCGRYRAETIFERPWA